MRASGAESAWASVSELELELAWVSEWAWALEWVSA
jgi:hypothetical protein